MVFFLCKVRYGGEKVIWWINIICRVINRDDVMCILMEYSFRGSLLSNLDKLPFASIVRWAPSLPAPRSEMVHSACSSELLLRRFHCSARTVKLACILRFGPVAGGCTAFEKCYRLLTGVTSDSRGRLHYFSFCSVLQVSPEFFVPVFFFFSFESTEVLWGSQAVWVSRIT